MGEQILDLTEGEAEILHQLDIADCQECVLTVMAPTAFQWLRLNQQSPAMIVTDRLDVDAGFVGQPPMVR